MGACSRGPERRRPSRGLAIVKVVNRGRPMGIGAQVGTSSVLSAYLRFVTVVGRMLVVMASGSIVAKSRDEADGSAAMAGMGVVGVACRGVPCSASQRTAIEHALLTAALRPRFPGIKLSAFDDAFHEVAEGVLDDVLTELALRDKTTSLLNPSIEGPTRGETFLDGCGELARAVADAAGNPPGSSAWLERYDAELRERFEAAPFIALGGPRKEGADDA
jgi:hypothetical protein